MKSFFLLSFAILFAGNIHATDRKPVKSEIRQVTVFLNRAQITSTASVNIDAGASELVIEGLPARIDQQSIQVSGKGDFIIMSVKHQMNYVDPLKKPREIIVLEDSLNTLQYELDRLRAVKDVYSKEEQMILANQMLKGDKQSITAEDIEEMADFYRSRLTDIKTLMLKNERLIKKVSERLNQFQAQLNEMNKRRNVSGSNILVSVTAKTKTNAAIEIQYVVLDAGWYPVYDIRAKDSKSPVQLNYKAEVFQNTGVSWDKVKLKLSTANPSVSGTKPELAVWYLNFYDPIVMKQNTRSPQPVKKAPMAPSAAYKGEDAEYEPAPPAENLSQYTKITETTLAAEFDIAILCSVPSDGKPQLIDVQTYELPATYRHFAVPRMDKDAFLVARVTGWEELNMLSGNAYIYFEGTFVGESFLDMMKTTDTIDFSLGRDPKVVVERKKQKDFSSRSFIGPNKKEEFAYEITIRNTKKDPVNLTIEDQIPVSRDSQIEVELLESAGAQVDKTTGKLTWTISLDSTETKKANFRYSIKYPKNKIVSGLN